jgi:hypothetical protein
VLSGCGSPNVASVEVRKQNQAIRDEVETLKRAREADAATIRSLQSQIGSVPTLSHERLAKLFTTHGLTLGRLTGGADLDRNKPGDEGIKVYAQPTDDAGEAIKAAGSFTVEAFDLAADPPTVGKWQFDLDAARKAWNGVALSRQYVLTCPWQQQGPPKHPDVTVKVTFRDELTGREYSEQRVVKVRLPEPASTAPTAAPPTAESR